MKKFKVSFFKPRFKNNFNYLPLSRQAFSEKGNVDNIIYSVNDYYADWHVVDTWTEDITDLEGKKIIYIEQEPPGIKLPAREILDKCTIALTFFNIEHKITQILAPPALQWSYDLSAEINAGIGHVYNKVNNNYLKDIIHTKVPKKTKLCSLIMSSKNTIEGHKKRVRFADALKNKFKNEVDVYGFGYNPIKNKKDAIDPYHYSIALENSQINNYWTEKISDVFLGHACPIYYGCKNITDFFSHKSLVEININEIDEALYIIENTINNIKSISMIDIIKARRSVLLNYNMLSIIALAINHVENNNLIHKNK